MYDADKKMLANQKFIINGQKIVTDDTGRYLVHITYRTSDRYRSAIQRWKANNTINEPSIHFSYNEMNKQIKNNWRKYGLRYCFKGTEYTLTKNFIGSSDSFLSHSISLSRSIEFVLETISCII
jgi:hypothetical protein